MGISVYQHYTLNEYMQSTDIWYSQFRFYTPIILLMKGFVYPIYAYKVDMHVPSRVRKAPYYKGFAHFIPRIVHR